MIFTLSNFYLSMPLSVYEPVSFVVHCKVKCNISTHTHKYFSIYVMISSSIFVYSIFFLWNQICVQWNAPILRLHGFWQVQDFLKHSFLRRYWTWLSLRKLSCQAVTVLPSTGSNFIGISMEVALGIFALWINFVHY